MIWKTILHQRGVLRCCSRRRSSRRRLGGLLIHPCAQPTRLWTSEELVRVRSEDSNGEDIYGAPDDDEALGFLRDAEPEDTFEVAPDPLPALPLVNNKKYPQEDVHYFKKKRYVRNDKYSLLEMVSYLESKDRPGEYDLPTIMDGYGKSEMGW